MLRADGSFGLPALIWELSSPQTDNRPTIRSDGLEVFLTSTRPGGHGGQDLWFSTRETTQDAWSRPVNLGPRVNTGDSEAGSALSFDGTTLYFVSNRPGGYGNGDIYMATRTRLPD